MRSRTNVKIALAMIAVWLGMACIAAGQVIYVDNDSPGDPEPNNPAISDPLEDGSPEHPFDAIQEAIDAAIDGDTVVVANGRYTGDGNRDIDFGGRAITVRSIEPNDSNIVAATIIDCNGTEPEPHRGFKFHKGEDANSILAGFTITNGYGPEEFIQSWYLSCGGAILCNESSPKITNCTITGNTAADDGGGICCYKSSASITECKISGNSARKEEGTWFYGGGVCLWAGNPTIADCTIRDNFVEGHRAYGGGIYCQENSPTITNCTISGNSAGAPEGYIASGGGIYCYAASPIITSCAIIANTAKSSGGGLCYCSGLVSNCLIKWNSASFGGGVFGGYGLVIQDCRIIDNSANNGGGLVSCSGPITNCIISGNTCRCTGGGLLGCSGPITNCTVVGNRGAGLSNCWGSITNCIVWSNPTASFWSCTTPTYTCFPEAGSGTNIKTNPCFVEPGYWADVNDPNIIVEPNDPNAIWVEGDYHLLLSSPCIDAGDNNNVPEDATDLDGDGNTAEPIPWDLDGELRFVDDPCTPDTGNGAPPIVDMGAFEFQLPGPIDLLLGLMEDVVDLNLHHGIANSLRAKLDAALKLLEDANENNDVATVNCLGAFINAVEAQRGKKIPEANADDLIAAAQEIIAVLSGM